MLSVADLMLAVLWVMGGGVWMSGGMGHTDHSRVGCFTIVLSTVVSGMPINIQSEWSGKLYSGYLGLGKHFHYRLLSASPVC